MYTLEWSHLVPDGVITWKTYAECRTTTREVIFGGTLTSLCIWARRRMEVQLVKWRDVLSTKTMQSRYHTFTENRVEVTVLKMLTLYEFSTNDTIWLSLFGFCSSILLKVTVSTATKLGRRNFSKIQVSNVPETLIYEDGKKSTSPHRPKTPLSQEKYTIV